MSKTGRPAIGRHAYASGRSTSGSEEPGKPATGCTSKLKIPALTRVLAQDLCRPVGRDRQDRDTRPFARVAHGADDRHLPGLAQPEVAPSVLPHDRIDVW